MIAALSLLALALVSTVALVCYWRRARAAERLRLRRSVADTVRPPVSMPAPRTVVVAVADARVSVGALPRAAVGLAADVRLLEGLDSLTYDPEVWER